MGHGRQFETQPFDLIGRRAHQPLADLGRAGEADLR
jgi:hypothetical protein